MQPSSTHHFSDLLNFDAQTIYLRTAEGQRELSVDSGCLSRSEKLLLGVVTGLTPLRVFLDMATPVDAPTAIRQLVEKRLIERVTPARCGQQH